MKTIKALPKDTDLAGVDKALRRAAKKARELAKKTILLAMFSRMEKLWIA